MVRWHVAFYGVVLVGLLAVRVPAQDLSEWCAQQHAGYVSAVDPETATGVAARLQAEPRARIPFESGDVEAGWYKQVLILQPLPPDPSWVARLSTCFDPADAKLLVREVYGRPEVTPETTQYILDAIEILGRKDATRQARLREACLWLAAPALGEVRWHGDSARRGLGLLRSHPEMPAGNGKAPYSVEFPAMRTDVPGGPIYTFVYAPQTDYFAQWLAAAKLPLSLDQYKQQQLEVTDKVDAPFADDERLKRPVLRGPARTTLGEALVGLSALSHVPLQTDTAERPVWLHLESMPLRHVLVALARVSGTALLRDGEGYRLARPVAPREQLLAAEPLVAWTYGQHDRAETWLAEAELRARFYRALDPQTADQALQAPPLLRLLPVPLREALTQVCYRDVARHLRLLAESLPGADGQIPLWAYPELEQRRYELVAPAYSEYLSGLLAVRADLAVRGAKVSEMVLRKARDGDKPVEGGQ